jgi:hypothetical protein
LLGEEAAEAVPPPAPTPPIAAKAIQTSQTNGDEEVPWPVDESGITLSESDFNASSAILANPEEEKDEEAGAKTVLPKLDILLDQLPANLKDSMEELFRAKWTHVIKVRKKDLRS